MEFEWIVAVSFWGTMAFYLAQAAMSVKEGTFSLGQLLEKKTTVNFHGKYRWQHLPMSFLNNWTASWGDLLVWPMVNALVVPILVSRYINGWLLGGWALVAVLVVFWALPAGIVASILVHRSWWHKDENLGHVFIGWNIGVATDDRVDVDHNNWYDDITGAGWVHFWFMALQVAIMLAYIFTPMPKAVVLWVNGLLLAFFAIQNIQSVVIQRGERYNACVNVAMEIFATGCITLIKI